MVQILTSWLVVGLSLILSLVPYSISKQRNPEKIWRIKSIEVAGSRELDRAVLQAQLHSTQIERWVTDSSIAEDIETNLRQLLQEHGFWEGDVSWYIVHDRDPDIRVVIKVSEGPKYHLGTIRVQAHTLLEDEEIAPLFSIKPGDVVDLKAIRKGCEIARRRNRLLEIYYKPSYHVDTTHHIVDVIFDLDENAPYYVAYVMFIGGGDPSKEEFLRSALGIRAGDVFLQSKMDSGIEVVNRIGLFQRIGEADCSVVPIKSPIKSLVGISVLLHPKR
jgi:outer membrane protein assembly factor BamA